MESFAKRKIEIIEIAANFVVESCKKGGKFYVFGTGHSHMNIMDIGSKRRRKCTSMCCLIWMEH